MADALKGKKKARATHLLEFDVSLSVWRRKIFILFLRGGKGRRRGEKEVVHKLLAGVHKPFVLF